MLIKKMSVFRDLLPVGVETIHDIISKKVDFLYQQVVKKISSRFNFLLIWGGHISGPKSPISENSSGCNSCQ